jgi:hypothetical protein
MKIFTCIRKIYPDWQGAVWGNKYDGIKPHELETRPIPTLKELEAVWPVIEAERIAADDDAKAEAEKESLIQAKMREQAIATLKVEGKLTADGKMISIKKVE